MWPEDLVAGLCGVQLSVRGHVPQPSWPDLLICNVMMLLRLLLGPDGKEDGEVLCTLSTLCRRCVICV